MTAEPLADIRDAILQRQRFVITSHARPDGDAIGSQLAMALALRELGKDVHVVAGMPAPPQFLDVSRRGRHSGHAGQWPGRSTPRSSWNAAICRAPACRGSRSTSSSTSITIPATRCYGAINWFDEGAAACGEMVFDLIEALGVTLTPEIATHIYIAILTDTGGFHFSHITPRTFEICRRCNEAGAQPEAIARAIYDSSTMARLRLMGAVLHNLEFEVGGRVALATLSLRAAAATPAATHEDSDGLINIPLTVKEIQAVAFFKEIAPDCYRISLRSKGNVDVNRVATVFGGGGHKNAAGCTLNGRIGDVRRKVVTELARALP